MYGRRLILLVVVALTFSGIQSVAAQEINAQKAIVSVERIWDRAGHNAFTDLIYFRGKYYCTFREGSGHIPGINGTIRIVASKDGQNWYSVALLSEKDVDLRDPKLCVTPDWRIMVVMGGSYYEGKKFIKSRSRVSFSDENGKNFTAPEAIFVDKKIVSDASWLWRVTWFMGKGYGVIYQKSGDELVTHLVETVDGFHYNFVTTFQITGKPNETTLRFLPDGRMVALVRREGEDRSAMIGSSEPPYKTWNWNSLHHPIGGPDFIVLQDGALICAGRHYLPERKAETELARVTLSGKYQPLFALPSSGDNSYPGMVIRNNVLYVSYYSSHEDKTAIYLAKIWLDRVTDIKNER